MMTLSIRGAISIDENRDDLIESAVQRLISLLLDKNQIQEEELSLILFSVTKDITALNPAAALRRGGRFSSVPLFCTQEPDCQGAMPFMIRVLVQFISLEKRSLFPVYLEKAAVLRPDLVEGNSCG